MSSYIGRQVLYLFATWKDLIQTDAAAAATSLQSFPTLWDPIDGSPPGSPIPGILRQEYWSGLPCSPPENLPNPGIEPRSPALQADSLPFEPPGKPNFNLNR